jgi:hypothetical protein
VPAFEPAFGYELGIRLLGHGPGDAEFGGQGAAARKLGSSVEPTVGDLSAHGVRDLGAEGASVVPIESDSEGTGQEVS